MPAGPVKLPLPAGPAEVESVVFGVAGDEENRALAAVEVRTNKLHNRGVPVTGGLYDLRMGTTSYEHVNSVTQVGRREDLGLFGRIEMHAPLVSPLFLAPAKGGVIKKWARAVCLDCGGLLAPREKLAALPPSRRLGEASKLAARGGAPCPHCRAAQPTIEKTEDDHVSFAFVRPGQAPEPVTAGALRRGFERVAVETIRFLGATYHPRKLLVSAVLVAPAPSRPSVNLHGPRPGTTHDLTNMYQHLVKRAQALEAGDADPARQVECASLLYHTLVLGASGGDGGGKRAITVGTRDPTSLMRSMTLKKGLIRGNALGSRTARIARTTISGNSDLRPDQVAIPLAFAQVLQVREVVRQYNLRRLTAAFLNRRQYPGVSQVIKRATGARHRVEGLRGDFALEVGDVVERDVVDGDLAYFNRQPTLERSSIGAHEVVVLRNGQLTFQMNVVITPLYNADFDGDQMNLWVPWTFATQTTAKYMSSVHNWFISSKKGSPAVAQVQDSVIGSFELTREAVRVDKFHAMRIFGATREAPHDFAGAGAMSGREIVSAYFRRVPVNLAARPAWFSEAHAPYLAGYRPSETAVVIRRGAMTSGVLDKATVGPAPGGLFHRIGQAHGSRASMRAIFALQQMAIEFAGRMKGVTASMHDMVVGPAAVEKIRAIVAGSVEEARLVEGRLRRGDIVPPIGMTAHDYSERLAIEALKVPDELLEPLLGGADPDSNGLLRLILTKSKGSLKNFQHMAGFVGQMLVGGGRPELGYGFQRSGPFVPRFSLDPVDRGFLQNSYIAGLTHREVVVAAQAARADLTAKALTTSVTGDWNRRVIVGAQSVVVDHFRRLALHTRVVAFLYGEDGLDPRFSESVPFRAATMADADFEALFAVPGAAASAELGAACAAARRALAADRAWYRAAAARAEAASFGNRAALARRVPINVARLIADVEVERGRGPGPRPGPAEVARMARAVAGFADRLPYAFLNPMLERRGVPAPAHLAAAARYFAMLVRTELAPAVLAGLDPAELDFLLATIRDRYEAVLVDPGTAAGVIAAQAVAETLTQYMLDSPHRSVEGGTDTGGADRPAEIYSAADARKKKGREKTPAMFIRLPEEFETDRAYAQETANRIELQRMRQFVRRRDLLVEPYGVFDFPAYAADARWVAGFERRHPLLAPPADLTFWCLRVALDPRAMVIKGMTLERLVEGFRAAHPDAYVVHTPETADATLRVYFRAGFFRGGADEKKAEAAVRAALDTPIHGVPGITEAKVVASKRTRPGAGGALETAEIFAVETRGSNLVEILAHPRVDPYRSVSSSILETRRVFGVGAARGAIAREIARFMGGSAPNARHITLIADLMTVTGEVSSLNKEGLRFREPKNVLARAAAGGPIKIFGDAALNGTESELYGINAYHMVGAAPRIGTFYSEVSVDGDYVREHVRGVEDVLGNL